MEEFRDREVDRWRLPYIGVTGFMLPGEVHQLVHLLADRYEDQDGTLKPGRLLMIGVLASDTTLRGEQNNWPNRYPAVKRIYDIFRTASDIADTMTFRVIHYNTQDQTTLADQLIELYETAGGHIVSGIQINMAWPPIDQIKRFREEVTSTHRTILHLGKAAMLGQLPDKIAYKVAGYGDLITDILIDPSGGVGFEVNPEMYYKTMDAIVAKTDGKIGVGFAGGLSKNSSEQLRSLYSTYSGIARISIDAQGRLRDPEDHLDIIEAFDYIEMAIEAIQFSRGLR